MDAKLIGMQLAKANMSSVDLRFSDLTGANLAGANMGETVLTKTNLTGANLSGADLSGAILIRTTIEGSNFSGARVFGASVWGLNGVPKDETGLIVTAQSEPTVTVNDLEVAQFIYLLLRPGIRKVIDTIATKSVLILGRFSIKERKEGCTCWQIKDP
jgi:hypothetical protein